MFRRRLPVSSLVALGLALTCGLGAALVVQGYAGRLERTRPDVGVPLAVVEASGPLPRGTALTPAMLREASIPSTFVPPAAVDAADDVVGAAFGGTQPHVETVAEGLEVAGVLSADDAAGAVTGAEGAGGPTLILLVTPDVARELTFAVAFAKLAVTVDPAGGPDAVAPSPSAGPSPAALGA